MDHGFISTPTKNRPTTIAAFGNISLGRLANLDEIFNSVIGVVLVNDYATCDTGPAAILADILAICRVTRASYFVICSDDPRHRICVAIVLSVILDVNRSCCRVRAKRIHCVTQRLPAIVSVTSG